MKRVPRVMQKKKHQNVLQSMKSKWYRLAGKSKLIKPFVCVPHPSNANTIMTNDTPTLVDINILVTKLLICCYVEKRLIWKNSCVPIDYISFRFKNIQIYLIYANRLRWSTNSRNCDKSIYQLVSWCNPFQTVYRKLYLRPQEAIFAVKAPS